jgi:formylglycine-generating enzyme required for sulfatase activity
MSDIFLSYARGDRERTLPVANALERSGWSVWWDQRLLAGEIFDEVIETELKAARAVVVLWSRTSVKSRWVRKEAVEADGDRKLVPALLDPVDIPLAIRDVQTVSLTDWDGDPQHPSFQDLRSAVRAVLERAGPELESRREQRQTVERRPVPRWSRSFLTRAALAIVVAAGGVYTAVRLRGPGPGDGSRASAPGMSPTPAPTETAAPPAPPPATPPPTPTPSPTPTHSPTPTPIHLSSSPYRPDMRQVPAGTFTMGSPASERDRKIDEIPHQVTLSRSFYIAQTEVTQAQYKALMGNNPAVWSDLGEDHPVESVSWYDSIRYCNALSAREGLEECYVIDGQDVRWPHFLDCSGYRLPTEAEWEYAARAEHPSPNMDLDQIAWYSVNSEHRTQPVGRKRPNRWGLKDTLGNVWEWVWDAYAPYPAGPVGDPIGPQKSGAMRVFRGCCLDNAPEVCRVAFRDSREPGHRAYGLGIRPSRTLR